MRSARSSPAKAPRSVRDSNARALSSVQAHSKANPVKRGNAPTRASAVQRHRDATPRQAVSASSDWARPSALPKGSRIAATRRPAPFRRLDNLARRVPHAASRPLMVVRSKARRAVSRIVVANSPTRAGSRQIRAGSRPSARRSVLPMARPRWLETASPTAAWERNTTVPTSNTISRKP